MTWWVATNTWEAGRGGRLQVQGRSRLLVELQACLTTKQNLVPRTRVRQRHTERICCWSRNMYICTHMHMHTYMHAYLHICMCAYIHAYMHTIACYFTHIPARRACQKASRAWSCTTSTQRRGSLARPGLRISSTFPPPATPPKPNAWSQCCLQEPAVLFNYTLLCSSELELIAADRPSGLPSLWRLTPLVAVSTPESILVF